MTGLQLDFLMTPMRLSAGQSTLVTTPLPEKKFTIAGRDQ